MDKRDQIIGRIIKDFQLSTEQYAYLTKLSIAQRLKEITEHGIRMETESLNKIIKAVEKGNEPVRKQIRWITCGMIAALGILLLMILLKRNQKKHANGINNVFSGYVCRPPIYF